MSQVKLRSEFIGLSIADYWQEACEEWSLDCIHRSDTPTTCLCGHHPIREVCTLVNKWTGEEAEVGNCCVEYIMNTGSKSLFRSLKKVVDDIDASLNCGVIELAYKRSLIDCEERDFYHGIWRKRKLSLQQYQQKCEINERLLEHFTR